MAYGTVNADVIGTSVAGSNLGAGDASIMKNRIINGAMVIDQRFGGASSTSNQVYTIDRWIYVGSQASKGTWGQNLNSVTAPIGFTNYLGFQSSSAYSVGSSDKFAFAQDIEGYNWADLNWGTANAKTVTLSFWVYSSLTGTFGGSLQNYAQTRSYPFSYTVSSANTWTQISITIAGDTTGTWVGATNGGALQLNIAMGVGSTLSGTAGAWASAYYFSATGATSVVGTNGATFYITGVQLEVGSSATGFEYVNYQTSLANCQRYYQIADGFSGGSYSGVQCISTFSFKTTMRASPTLGQTGVITITYAGNADYTQSSTGISINASTRVSANGVQALLANYSGLPTNTVALQHNVGSGSITLSAEL